MASTGMVNAIFRIGDRLAARFPLMPADPEATRAVLVAEAVAARRRLGRMRVSTPEPVAIGEPGPDYPMPWSGPGMPSTPGHAGRLGSAGTSPGKVALRSYRT